MKIDFNFSKTQERIINLNTLYNKTYSDNGICKYYKQCSSGMNTKFGYNSSFCAKIGKYYDMNIDGQDIRIVFVGKEGPNFQSYVGRPAKLSESLNKNGSGVTQHWLTSYKMLCDMLNANSYKSIHGTYKEQPAMCLQTFALTNTYRCAFKNKSEDQRTEIPNNELQNQHCVSILMEELKILEPTIIILQSNELKSKNLFNKYSEIKPSLCLTNINGENCYIIETYHPSWHSSEGNWEKLKRPEFIDNIEYLRKINVLPQKEYDVCEYINESIEE